MKTLITASLAALAFVSLAHAGEMQGKVKDVDMDKHMIVMEDGMSVMTNDNVKLDGIMKGDNVKIMTDDKNMATMVDKM